MSRLSLPTVSSSRIGARWGSSFGPWGARLVALSVWAGVAASVAYWWLSLGTQSQLTPGNAQVSGLGSALRGDVARLLGDRGDAQQAPSQTQVAAASRFKVLGVVGSVRGSRGVALMTVDTQQPRAYAVGARVDGDWVVLAVTQKSVEIGPVGGPAVVTLELAALPPAATGQLPAAVNGTGVNTGAGVGIGSGGGMSPPPMQVPMVPQPPMIPMPNQQGNPVPPQMRSDGTVVPQDPVASAPN